MMESKLRPGGGPPQAAVFEFEAGILICGRVRDCLQGLQFKGSQIEWWEGKGWFSRNFIIKGKPDEVMEAKIKLIHENNID